MDFLIGALGAVSALLIFGGGFAAGWYMHERLDPTPGEPEEPSVQKRKATEAANRAFQQMMGFNIGDVYGTPAPDDALDGEDG